MKKFLVLISMSAVACLIATSAFAGIVNSRHDMATSDNPYTTLDFSGWGACSPCHIPHGAGAERLFPSSIAGGLGLVGNLCLSCHDNSVLDNVNTVVNFTVIPGHGLTIANMTGMGTDQTIATSGLPYADGTGPDSAAIECTTCHEIHNQTGGQRPFLPVALDDICEDCHSARENNDTTTTGYSNPNSTHPAGPAFTGDVSGIASGGAGGDSPISMAGVVNNDDLAGGSVWATTTWNSGWHLSGNTSGGGVDCITCHTVHFDEDNGTTADNGTGFLGFVGDNAGGENNAFCEFCHQGSNTGSAGTYYWNPGNTAYSHPCDDVDAQDTTISVTVPWTFVTYSSQTGTGASGLVCTSCHGVHRQDTGGQRSTTASTPILLTYTTTDVCAACHTYSGLGFNHHPVGTSLYATAGNGTDGLTCGGAVTGTGKCHGYNGANGSMAHNLSADIGVPNTENSTMCTDCHTTDPSTYIPARSYTASGLASHYVGDTGAETWDKGRTTGTTTIRSAGSTVVGTLWDGSGLASKWGANDTTIICESCHRLANGNIISGDGASLMMVEQCGSLSVVGDGTYDYGTNPNLCAGCHLIPSGTHPLGNANGAAYAAPSGTGFSYLADNTMNCESCHSAHQGQTWSGSFILDGSAGTGGGSTGMEVEPSINYTGYCAECHSAFQ